MSTYKNESKYKEALLEYLKDENITMKYLSDKYGFDRVCFSRYLKKNNIKIRSCAKNKETADKYDKGLELYNNGFSINQIHEEIGISKKNFTQYLKSKGINIRYGFTKKDLIVNENYFETIDSSEKAYWLGFIFADGYVKDGKDSKLSIELSVIDKLHLKKFIDCIESNAEIANRKNRPTCSITIYRQKIVNDLKQYGCIPNKTIDGYINIELLNGFEKDFLRGYLDGDGFIEKNYKKYRASYVVKSELIAKTLMSMLYDFHPRLENCNTFYRIHIERKATFFALLDYLYSDADMYLQRKYYTYLDRKHAVLGQLLLEDPR